MKVREIAMQDARCTRGILFLLAACHLVRAAHEAEAPRPGRGAEELLATLTVCQETAVKNVILQMLEISEGNRLE